MFPRCEAVNEPGAKRHATEAAVAGASRHEEQEAEEQEADDDF